MISHLRARLPAAAAVIDTNGDPPCVGAAPKNNALFPDYLVGGGGAFPFQALGVDSRRPHIHRVVCSAGLDGS